MKHSTDLSKKKKKIKTVNNKMAINTYPSTIESRKQTKQIRTETESWIQRMFQWLPDGGRVRGMGRKGKGIKNYKFVVTE